MNSPIWQVGEPSERFSGPGSIVRMLAAELAVEGPLRINEVNYPDPVVGFVGEDWAMSMLSPWRLMRHGSVVVEPDTMTGPFELRTEIVTDALWELIGHEIVGVTESPRNPNDPVFELTGGYTVEVDADTDLDPWVISVGGRTYVGTMSTPLGRCR